MELKVPVITQQTPVWCWAATASMALRLVGFPDLNPAKNYQCGVVAVAFDDCQDDCTKCVTPIRSMSDLVAVLDRYRDLSMKFRGVRANGQFDPNYVAYPQLSRVKRSLKMSYPVIAGISPDARPDDAGATKHMVLITGYDDDYRGSREQWVILTDPYPYAPGTSPYTVAGYPYDPRSRKARLPWSALRDRMNLTSAVFLERRSA